MKAKKTKELIKEMYCLLEKENINFDINKTLEVDEEIEKLEHNAEVGECVINAVENDEMSANQLEEILNSYRTQE